MRTYKHKYNGEFKSNKWYLDIFNLIASAGLIFLVIYILIHLLFWGVEKVEMQECATWYAQSQSYSNWFASEWQIDQCEQFGIDIK